MFLIIWPNRKVQFNLENVIKRRTENGSSDPKPPCKGVLLHEQKPPKSYQGTPWNSAFVSVKVNYLKQLFQLGINPFDTKVACYN